MAYQTISGPIVTFNSDFSSKIKNLIVTINPVQAGTGDPSPDNVRPISGWGEVDMWRTGKNLLEISPNTYSSSGGANAEYLYNGVRVYNTIAGVYRYTAWKFLVGSLVGQTLRFSCDCEGTGRRVLARFYYADNTPAGSTLWERTEAHVDSGITIPATLPPDAYLKIGFYCTETVSAIGEVTYTNIQLELGSTATAYAPYTGTSYPITIPAAAGTVYGGYIQVAEDGSAELVEDMRISTLTGGTGELWSKSGSVYINRGDSANCSTQSQSKLISNKYKSFGLIPDESALTEDCTFGLWSNDPSRLYLRDDQYENVTALRAGLSTTNLVVCYELATPQRRSLSPINLVTLIGQNNIWADCGDVTLDYHIGVDSKPLLLTPKYANTVSGNIATFSTNITSPLKSCVVTFNPVQSGSGDPSPDNVRPISGWTGCNVQNNSLPAEYQRVEYLESGSDCYILTDYYPTEKTTYKSKGAITSSGWVFGSRTARSYGDSMGWLLTTSSNYKTFRVDYAEQQLEINYKTSTRRFRVESSYNNGTWSYVAYTGDTDSIFEQGSVSERTFTGAYPLVLFGLNNGGAISTYDGVKLFYLTLMEEEQITADFVPCYRKSDNTPGMYDIVGRKFYTNSGTGTFVTGPNISSGTTIPISWQTEAGTVYGGTLDITTGVLTVTFASATINSLSGLTYYSSRQYFQTSAYSSAKKGTNNVVSNNLCSCYKTLAPNNIQNLSFSVSTQRRFVFRDDRFKGDTTEFLKAVGNEMIVYELDTPITYQLTPQQISALEGNNSIWADCGPVLVTYYKTSMLFIS